MKIIFSFFCLFSLGLVFSATTIMMTPEEKFNTTYELALQKRWGEPQDGKEFSLFDEAKKEVQGIRDIPEDMKPTERINKVMNTFCEFPFGSCDETSLSSRFKAGCADARDDAIDILQRENMGYVTANTEFVKASYTNCETELAQNTIDAYRVSGLTKMTEGVAEVAEKAHTTFLEKLNNQFQEKVGNIWDVFSKKLTNFARSIQGTTKTVHT